MPEAPFRFKATAKKFTPPSLRKVLPRERLFRRLDETAHSRAVWISGPAGSGKSTLAASYLAQRGAKCIWYRIDSGDSDLATFFYCLGLAVDRWCDLPRPLLPLFTPEYMLGVDRFAVHFFQKLGQRFKGPLWLVLDNVQEASAEPGLMEVVRHAMGRGAPGVKICVISRNEAPPVMVRGLANQTLVTIGWPDLAFSVAEYAEIIKKLAPCMTADKIAGRLHRQTKGWISGLILCLQQDADDIVLADLPEGHTRIFDYFAAENLHTLTPLWRSFLLRSSLLDGMSIESAARMTGIDCAGDILESLTERNSFIEKHPGPVTIYRYHPLFRDFLRHYLAKTMAPDAVRSLYRRAAAILAESGSMNEAVSLYSSGKDWDGLAEAILTHAPALIAQGRHQTLKGWLRLLPESICRQRPMLIFYQGLSRVPLAPLKARAFFTDAFSEFVRQNDLYGRVLSWSYIAESFYIARAGTIDLAQWIGEGEQLHDLLPSDGDALLSTRLCLGMLTALMLAAPGDAQLPVWLERCRRGLLHAPTVTQQMIMANMFVVASCLRGEMHEAAIMIEQVRSRSRTAVMPAAGRINLHLMECLFYMVAGENEQCAARAAEALAFCSQWGVRVFDGLLNAFSAYAALASENLPSARGDLARIADSVPPDASFDLTHFYCLSAWEAYASGDLTRALALSREGARFAAECGWPAAILISRVLQAKLLAECGSGQEAETIIASTLQESRTQHIVLAEFYGLLALAEVRMLQGAFEAMREPLTQALAISRAKGVLTGHWSLRARLAELCQWALRFGIDEQQTLMFIRRHRLLPKTPQLANSDWPFAVKIRLLGRRAITCHEQPVAGSVNPPRRVLELLDLMICKGPRGITRESTMDLLWPDSDGDRAQQNLNTTLHRLRRLLGSDRAVAAEGGRLYLSQEHCWVDTWCFEEAVALAFATDSADSRREMLQKAISLYAGPPAVGVRAWSIGYTEHLKRKFVRAVLESGRLRREGGDPDAALSVYQEGLKIEEASESLCFAQLRLLDETGRTSEAVKRYTLFRRRMRIAEDREPGIEIASFYQILKKRAAAGGGIEPAAVRPASRSPGGDNRRRDDR